MHPLATLCSKDRKQVIGLMSGTSADGLDCALCTVTGYGLRTRIESVTARTYPYGPADRDRILSLCDRSATVQAICEGSFWLGELFADRVLRLLDELGKKPGDVDLIGSHGQTVWHQPPSMVAQAAGVGRAMTPATLQLGEPAVLAARTGILTVGDFRVADVALGGEGAPLVPFCDFVLFRRPDRVRALQNIGGIANVTLLPAGADESHPGGDSDDDGLADSQRVLAFDNGPGNMMIDVLAELASDGALGYDCDGVLSAQGVVQPDLLAQLMADPYLQMPPPKSTGRERYGRAFTQAFAAAHRDRRPLDLLRTAVEFTAAAIAASLAPRSGSAQRSAAPCIDELLVSGGGAHNRTLMRRLAELLAPLPVRPLAEAGIDVDCKEAVAFALLAVQAVHGEPGNLPSVTGARGPAVLGKLCLPPR